MHQGGPRPPLDHRKGTGRTRSTSVMRAHVSPDRCTCVRHAHQWNAETAREARRKGGRHRQKPKRVMVRWGKIWSTPRERASERATHDAPLPTSAPFRRWKVRSQEDCRMDILQCCSVLADQLNQEDVNPIGLPSIRTGRRDEPGYDLGAGRHGGGGKPCNDLASQHRHRQGCQKVRT